MMASPWLRVLMVLGPGNGDTAERVSAISAGLVGHGHRVVVAGPRETGAAFPFTDNGARFVEVRIGQVTSPRDLAAARSLARWVKGADVVHAHGPHSAMVALSAGAGRSWLTAGIRKAGVPLLVSWPYLAGGGGADRPLNRLDRAVARGATLSVCSSAELERAVQLAGGRVVCSALPFRGGNPSVEPGQTLLVEQTLALYRSVHDDVGRGAPG